MSVRPVIGIPWTKENAAYFDAIVEGASFQLMMNTGTILTFSFEDKSNMRRSETSIFRQVSPGLVLLLLGETDEEGFPTATHMLITATYPREQEPGRIGELIRMAVPPSATLMPEIQLSATPTPIPFLGLDVQIICGTTQAGQITTRFRLYNAGTLSIPIEPTNIRLRLAT